MHWRVFEVKFQSLRDPVVINSAANIDLVANVGWRAATLHEGRKFFLTTLEFDFRQSQFYSLIEV